MLAEAWGWSMEQVLKMTTSRRRHALLWKARFEQKSAEAAKARQDGFSFDRNDIIDIWGA